MLTRLTKNHLILNANTSDITEVHSYKGIRIAGITLVVVAALVTTSFSFLFMYDIPILVRVSFVPLGLFGLFLFVKGEKLFWADHASKVSQVIKWVNDEIKVRINENTAWELLLFHVVELNSGLQVQLAEGEDDHYYLYAVDNENMKNDSTVNEIEI